VEDKKKLSERDICTQYITPALQQAGRDFATQVRVEVSFANGRVIVRGKLHTRGKQKGAGYVLYQAPQPAHHRHRGQGQQPFSRRRHAAGAELRRDARRAVCHQQQRRRLPRSRPQPKSPN
jgi:hypothetical protein